MPSNCVVKLKIKGLRKDVKEIINTYIDVSDGCDTLNYMKDDLTCEKYTAESIIMTYRKCYLISFKCDWVPPILWVKELSEKYPYSKFTMVWYNMILKSYGYMKSYHAKNLYKECRYTISDDDITYLDSNDDILLDDTMAKTKRCSGNFAKILSKVDYFYEKKL